ncbi:MAG: YraN family protein [Acidimicrobiales bacterium]|nr:YraN family protein [Acidimicrobiales bacterium]
MTRARQRLGAYGEGVAARFYLAHGYELLDRNWRVREGELDLICRRGGDLVFVEVKTRSSNRFGTGAEAVTPVKQQRIRRLALLWLRSSDASYRSVRFDVVVVDARGNVRPFKNAF